MIETIELNYKEWTPHSLRMTSLVEEKQRIRELKYRYCYATDDLDADALIDTFTEDGTFEIGFYGTAAGHDELREYLDWFSEQGYAVRAHNAFNPLITVDGDSADGKWYYLVYYELSDERVVIAQGKYSDTYRKTDRGWKSSSVKAQRLISKTFDPSGST